MPDKKIFSKFRPDTSCLPLPEKSVGSWCPGYAGSPTEKKGPKSVKKRDVLVMILFAHQASQYIHHRYRTWVFELRPSKDSGKCTFLVDISVLAFVLVYIIERLALKNVEVGNYQMRQSLQVYRNGFIQLIRFSSSLMMALASWTLSWEASG